MKSEYPKLRPLELLHVAWKDHNKRIGIDKDPEKIQGILCYNKDDVPLSPFNSMRNDIMAYIKKYADRLSLPCDGNCYGHTDGVVIFCHQQLMKDINSNDN
jgi:hypothetical protein